MKPALNAKTALIVILAVVLGVAVIRNHSMSNVSVCVQAPGCTFPSKEPLGTLSTKQYGYPLAYRQVVTFVPVNNNAGYASASTELEGLSTVDVVVNVIFWFALLSLVASFIPTQQPAKQPSKKPAKKK